MEPLRRISAINARRARLHWYADRPTVFTRDRSVNSSPSTDDASSSASSDGRSGWDAI